MLYSDKLVPRDKDPSTGKTKFNLNDEIALSHWMENNLIMHFYPNSNFDQIEDNLIEHFNPPLNLAKNKNPINYEFRKNLSRLRNKIE